MERRSSSSKTLDFMSGHFSKRSLDSVHSLPEPRELTPTTELGSLQLQTEKNRLKLEEVETVVNSVHKRLEDTRNGLEDVRLKLGTFELGHRFFHTLRTASLKDEVIPRDGSSSDGTGSPGLAAVGSTESTQAVSLGQLEAMVSSSRLEAIEAACEDLRHNIQEVTSVPEATERLLKSELRSVVEKLQEELQLERYKVDRNAQDVMRVEASGAELSRRLEEAERMIREVQQDHGSELLATKSRLDVAIRACDEQVCMASELQSVLKAELRHEVDSLASELQMERSKVVQNSMSLSRAEVAGVELSQRMEVNDLRIRDLQQACEGHSVEASALRVRLETAMRECSQQASMSEEIQAGLEEERRRRVAEAAALGLRVESIEQAMEEALRIEVKQEFARVWDELERSKIQLSTTCGSPAGAVASPGLLRRLEALDEAVAEVRQHHADEAAALSVRIEEAVGLHKLQLPRIEDLGSRLSEEVSALRQRLAAVEKQLVDAPPVSNVAAAAAGSPSVSFKTIGTDATQTTSAAPSANSVDELRAALTATCSDVATLARNLATVREEHDAAITSIGSLTEFVARAAATSIHRTEELALKREEYERVSSSRSDEARSVAESGKLQVQGAGKDLADLESSGGASPGSFGATMQAAATAAEARVGTLAAELRAEAEAKAAATEVRIAAVEQLLGADLKRIGGMLAGCVEQLEVTQSDVHDLQPRVKALEAEAAKQGPPLSPKALAVEGPGQLRKASLAPGAESMPARLEATPPGREPSPPPRPTTPTFAAAAVVAPPPLLECLGSPLPHRRVEGPAVGHDPASPTARGDAARWVEDPPAPTMLMPLPSGTLMSQVAMLHSPTQTTRLGKKEVAAAGLKEKLEGIVSSVHHVLGALNLGELSPTPPQVVQYTMLSRGQVASGMPTMARSASGPALRSPHVLQRDLPAQLVSLPPASTAQSPQPTGDRRTLPLQARWVPPPSQGGVTPPQEPPALAAAQQQPQLAKGGASAAADAVAGAHPLQQSPPAGSPRHPLRDGGPVAREHSPPGPRRALVPQQAAQAVTGGLMKMRSHEELPQAGLVNAGAQAAASSGSAVLPVHRAGNCSPTAPAGRRLPSEEPQLCRRTNSQRRLHSESGAAQLQMSSQPSSARATIGGPASKGFSHGLHMGTPPPVVRPGIGQQGQRTHSSGASGHQPSSASSGSRAPGAHLQGVSPAMMGVLSQWESSGSSAPSNRSSLNSKRGGASSGASTGAPGTTGFASPQVPGRHPIAMQLQPQQHAAELGGGGSRPKGNVAL